MRLVCLAVVLSVVVFGQQQTEAQREQAFFRAIQEVIPGPPQTVPLYSGAIPNSIEGAADQESATAMGGVQGVSRPTITSFLPIGRKGSGAAVILFPGGGYVMETMEYEGTSIAQEFRDGGVAAFVVKYRLPSDKTMVDKTVGPLQDAQQAIKFVREHAAGWKIDSHKIGVMGFSAGGHLAATVGTHFGRSYIPNDSGTDLRPDFMILIYPVISMSDALAHTGSRTALLGKTPTAEQIRAFSNDEQVTEKTPTAMLVAAGDDMLVEADNSVAFYEALHHHHVAAELLLLPEGNHGFFSLARADWLGPVFRWMVKNGWMKP